MGKGLWGPNKLLTQLEAPWKVLLWESQQEWLGAWFGVMHMGQIQEASLPLPRQVTLLEDQPLLSEMRPVLFVEGGRCRGEEVTGKEQGSGTAWQDAWQLCYVSW